MSTAEEMRAITATFSAQGAQQALPLAAAGYVEVLDLSKRYKPLPDAYVPNAVWLSGMVQTFSHCAQ